MGKRSGTPRQYGYGGTRPQNSGYKDEPGKVVPITPANKPQTRHASKGWKKDPDMKNKAGKKGVIAPNVKTASVQGPMDNQGLTSKVKEIKNV